MESSKAIVEQVLAEQLRDGVPAIVNSLQLVRCLDILPT
jgi:hypothetical protein